MTTGIWILLSFLFVAALAGTIFAFKQEERKMKKYEAEGDTTADELRRSHEYETSSLKSNVPLLSSIYIVTIILAIIAFIIYIN
ncbi:hypothetical protein CFK37_16800 [Virgibacillus phasianinus]|uniref:Uncharacterized protein n=1 Tax=Virgibacillus phasianinus TaxID=2017483 RepID=A0A220U6E6_9BACI|nr:hypothetical protein [Virgibacillus phasianinus]ASK63697.1 hypothetical protein CFK37_16800 [Virgibacillus phasianinus]